MLISGVWKSNLYEGVKIIGKNVTSKILICLDSCLYYYMIYYWDMELVEPTSPVTITSSERWKSISNICEKYNLDYDSFFMTTLK